MSIYTRSYMRPDSYSGSPRPFNMIKWILIVLVFAFVLQNVVNVWIGGDTGASILGFFWFTQGNLSRGLIHTPFTYALLHQGFLHILFNGLIIYFGGRWVQERLGSVRVLEFFLLAVFSGAILWLVVNALLGRQAILIGASAGALGLLVLFSLYQWKESIRFFILVFPVTMTGKQIVIVVVGLQLFFFLFSELAPGPGSTVAYSAHLGGIGVAYLYYRFLSHRRTFFEVLGLDGSKRASRREKRTAATRQSMGRYKVNLQSKPSPEVRAEVDRILDKINEQGFGSLTEEEKSILDQAKDSLR